MTPEQLEEMEARANRVLTNGTTSGSARALAKNVLTLADACTRDVINTPRHDASCIRTFATYGCTCR